MQAIAGGDEPIDLIAPSGRMIGRVSPDVLALVDGPRLSPDRLAEIQRRMDEAKQNPHAFKTWSEIKYRLQSQESA